MIIPWQRRYKKWPTLSSLTGTISIILKIGNKLEVSGVTLGKQIFHLSGQGAEVHGIFKSI